MDNVACVVMYCDMVCCAICETLGSIDSMLCGGDMRKAGDVERQDGREMGCQRCGVGLQIVC